MKKETTFILTCFFSLYGFMEEETGRELTNKELPKNQALSCVKSEDILDKVEYMKKEGKPKIESFIARNKRKFYFLAVAVILKIGIWSFDQLTRYLSHDGEWQSKKDSNKKNQQDYQDREDDQDRENI